MQLCKRGEAEMGSQVGMHICTDACTHLNWSFFSEKRGLFIDTCIKQSPIYEVKCTLVPMLLPRYIL